jgi:hypothetical protein
MILNKTKRKIIGVLFVFLFIILAPAIIFYATGSRFGESWKILQTGGLFVRSVPPGSTVYINSKLNKETGYFDRNILVKSLHPGTYSVLIEKEGYNSWKKEMAVYGNVVTDSRAFMLPKIIETTEVKKYLESEAKASTSIPITKKNNPVYLDVVALFSASSTPKSASTSSAPIGTVKNPIVNRNYELWREGTDVFLKWAGRKDSTPVIFCDNEVCQEKIKSFSFDQPIARLDFFPGESEIALAAVNNKIYAFELDLNPDKVPQFIYSGDKPDFRVDDSGTIFVKDGAYFGEIDI